jgi:hypothetical protein
MKKMTLAFAVLMLAVFSGAANADVGNNPNSFELDMDCEGEWVHITVPVINAEASQVSDGRVAISRTHYIDFNFNGEFEQDELVASILRGRGIQTTFCTWIWDNDPFVHGMDIQFVPPK